MGNNQQCKSCKNAKKVATDLWAETVAMWQPCPECCPEDYERFWSLPNDTDRVNWFSMKAATSNK